MQWLNIDWHRLHNPIWRRFGSIFAQDDPEVADQFLRELIERFILLSKNQLLGIRQPAFDENLRLFPYKKYLVFYFPTEFGVEVSRVLHSARDIESIFDA